MEMKSADIWFTEFDHLYKLFPSNIVENARVSDLHYQREREVLLEMTLNDVSDSMFHLHWFIVVLKGVELHD